MMEDLMKPRYKQIADWPFMGNRYAIGNVFTFDTEVEAGIIGAYPHLFKRLQWWQERTEEEVLSVKYVKANGNLYKGEVYEMEYLTAIYGYMSGNRDHFKSTIPNSYGTMLFELRYFEPATKEEYELTKNGLLDGK